MNSLEQQLKDAVGQYAYVTCALLTNLENWERKEYEQVKEVISLKIKGINCAIEYVKKHNI